MIYGHVSAPMDLRTTEISHGNFETFVLNAAVVQMADRYGMPSRITPGNTSAKSVGERSAVEAAVGMFIGAAAGGNIVMTGLLDSTLMISYEHLVLVDELINQLRSAQSPIRTDAESLAVNVIGRAAGGGQSYLESDHTVRFMKRDLYLSEFTGEVQGSYEGWYEKAHLRVQDTLRAEGSADGSPQALERLAAVEARLREDDKSWREGRGDWWRPYLRDLL